MAFSSHRRRPHYGRRNNPGPQSGNRFNSSKIRHDMYISQAVLSEPESIYNEDMTYSEFELLSQVQANIDARGYIHPTKIQSQVIPSALEGKDILAMARTGSGKTAAFLIPMVNKLIQNPGQRCLIILPTRELAQQTDAELKTFVKVTQIRSAVVIGGTNMYRQISEVKRNPQIVIATPGRLRDLFQRRIINLASFKNIVLDEVDHMLDMGFVHEIRFIISQMPKEKQSMFLSATMPREAERIANELLVNPVRFEVKEAVRQQNIEQNIIKVPAGQNKLDVLVDHLKKENTTKVLIFSKTKHGADKLSNRLALRGFRVDAIHGNKSQAKRTRVIELFKQCKIDILVATDVAARGVDIQDITMVINYDEPANYDDYIHRIGRTGRIGKKGYAFTFVE
ncbi:MAG: DEAD/DEAH box helicase [Candidatus Dojkabacteria bacterium]|nr:MAG: DEAD/DEAH box helicase [Candidatus Dojkabacteria bacterium]